MSHYMDSKSTQFLSPTVQQNGGHMIMTNVQKPTKTKYVNIDTLFQEEYNQSQRASLVYNLPQQINCVKSMALTHAEIPYSFYNFSEYKGNTAFLIATGSDEYPIKISDNYYTDIVMLQTEIQSKINDYSGLLGVVTCNVVNGFQIEFSASDSNVYEIYWNVSAQTMTTEDTSDQDYDNYKLKSRLGWCLGFREPSGTFGVNSPLQSVAMVNIQTTRYLFLVVDEFSQSYPNTFVCPLADSLVNKNILARIQIVPHDHHYGGTIVGSRENIVSDIRTYMGKTDIYKMKFELVDEWGTVVNLNQMDFSFVLRVEYE